MLSRNRLLFVLLGLLLIFLVFELWLLFQPKLNQKNLQSQYFTYLLDEKIPLGISDLTEVPTYESYKITGLLKKYYTVGDRWYLELVIPGADEARNIQIDLGDENGVVPTYTTQRELQRIEPTITEKGKTGVVGRYKRSQNKVTTKDLSSLLKSHLDRFIQVEILYKPLVTKEKCASKICTQRLNEFEKYRENNTSLYFERNELKKVEYKVGAVLSIEFE